MQRHIILKFIYILISIITLGIVFIDQQHFYYSFMYISILFSNPVALQFYFNSYILLTISCHLTFSLSFQLGLTIKLVLCSSRIHSNVVRFSVLGKHRYIHELMTVCSDSQRMINMYFFYCKLNIFYTHYYSTVYRMMVEQVDCK